MVWGIGMPRLVHRAGAGVTLAVVALGLALLVPRAAAAKPTAAPVQPRMESGTQAYLDSMDPVLLANQQTLMAFKGWLISQPGHLSGRVR
jgi:hypothetical protein